MDSKETHVMEPITANARMIQESNTMTPPASPYTYLGVAEGLMPGVKPLVDALPSGTSATLAFVCAHVLECLLKAYLSRGGSDAALRQPSIRHNLSALWKKAYKQGLPVSDAPPDWVECLSGLHNEPYPLRYSIGIDRATNIKRPISAILLPAAEPMVTELVTLLEVVRQLIR
jgi:hypothetical protein